MFTGVIQEAKCVMGYMAINEQESSSTVGFSFCLLIKMLYSLDANLPVDVSLLLISQPKLHSISSKIKRRVMLMILSEGYPAAMMTEMILL